VIARGRKKVTYAEDTPTHRALFQEDDDNRSNSSSNNNNSGDVNENGGDDDNDGGTYGDLPGDESWGGSTFSSSCPWPSEPERVQTIRRLGALAPLRQAVVVVA